MCIPFNYYDINNFIVDRNQPKESHRHSLKFMHMHITAIKVLIRSQFKGLQVASYIASHFKGSHIETSCLTFQWRLTNAALVDCPSPNPSWNAVCVREIQNVRVTIIHYVYTVCLAHNLEPVCS